MGAPYIVAVGGTLRANSTTERAMRYVLDAAQRAGARTKLISGASLQLPLYQPDNAERSDAARDLVAELALADGIVLGSPGYHGSISGLVKNALDYAEDLRTDVRPYFSGRAVGCIATAGGWSAA
ncbi:MAG TPA: NAD(P)H-dependent oxidoreductase, partial [Steroidobacteraceae bacterium]|nr:NAD(P)H-dependent oxidoreductase [Steroidobacteraceae bacterium]